MARLSWNAIGERYFEAGVDRGVLYPKSSDGVPWNGLIGVNETPVGGDVQSYYFDGVKYYQEAQKEEYSATIEAYTYPDEFDECNGIVYEGGLLFTAQQRRSFGLSYRTKIGNDTEGIEHGYKIHLVYNALASPNSSNYTTVAASTNAMSFTWAISALPVIIPGKRSTAHLIVDSRKTSELGLKEIEDILYGGPKGNPRLPTPEELTKYAGLSFWKVDESKTTDYYLLTPDGRDLMGVENTGIYQIPPSSRISPTEQDGFYDWEKS